jgi:hypothetical protein
LSNASVADGADLQYAVTPAAVKERIVLRERPTTPLDGHLSGAHCGPDGNAARWDAVTQLRHGLPRLQLRLNRFLTRDTYTCAPAEMSHGLSDGFWTGWFRGRCG